MEEEEEEETIAEVMVEEKVVVEAMVEEMVDVAAVEVEVSIAYSSPSIVMEFRTWWLWRTWTKAHGRTR